MRTTRFFSALLILVTLLVLSSKAQAADTTAEGTCGANLIWTLDSDGTLTISGTGAMSGYSDDVYNAAPWYTYRDQIQRLVVEEGVATLGNYAFRDCSALTEVSLCETLRNVDSGVFKGCSSLTELRIPSSVTRIYSGFLSGCGKLEKLEIPFVGGTVLKATDYPQYPFGIYFGTEAYDGATAVSQSFRYTKNINSKGTYYVPSSLREVTVTGGDLCYGAFAGCNMLTHMTLTGSVETVQQNSLCWTLTHLTADDCVTVLEKEILWSCENLEELTIPFVGKGFTTSYSSEETLFGHLFGRDSRSLPAGKYTAVSQTDPITNKRLTRYIPNSLKKVTVLGGEIYDNAFENCSMLQNIILGDDVTAMGDSAFLWCEELETVIVGSGITEISYNAFCNCKNLKTAVIPGTVTQIGASAFRGCTKLETVFYDGARSEWDLISVEGGNDPLETAAIVCTCSGHFWVDATCAAARHYSECGAAVGKPTSTHAWGDWVEQTPPTCTETGEEKRECADCDHFELRDVPVTGHSHTPVVTAPTCSEPGYTTYTCTCGDSYVEDHLDPAEHTFSAGMCTACGEDTVIASLEDSALTLSGEPQEPVRLLAAGYDGDGRFSGLQELLWQGEPLTKELPVWERTSLFFLDETRIPLRASISLNP